MADPAENRAVVAQNLPATWTKDDAQAHFAACGALERLTHIPRKALALMTFVDGAGADRAVALNGTTPQGGLEPLAVQRTERKANQNADNVGLGKRRNRGVAKPPAPQTEELAPQRASGVKRGRDEVEAQESNAAAAPVPVPVPADGAGDARPTPSAVEEGAGAAATPVVAPPAAPVDNMTQLADAERADDAAAFQALYAACWRGALAAYPATPWAKFRAWLEARAAEGGADDIHEILEQFNAVGAAAAPSGDAPAAADASPDATASAAAATPAAETVPDLGSLPVRKKAKKKDKKGASSMLLHFIDEV